MGNIARLDLAEAVREFPGILGVAVKNLDTGEAFAVNGETRFPTASLIKVAVMVEVFQQLAEGKIRREASVDPDSTARSYQARAALRSERRPKTPSSARTTGS